jgi:hypothetical protein
MLGPSHRLDRLLVGLTLEVVSIILTVDDSLFFSSFWRLGFSKVVNIEPFPRTMESRRTKHSFLYNTRLARYHKMYQTCKAACCEQKSEIDKLEPGSRLRVCIRASAKRVKLPVANGSPRLISLNQVHACGFVSGRAAFSEFVDTPSNLEREGTSL